MTNDIKNVLIKLNLECNDNVINLYSQALDQLLDETIDCSVYDFVKQGFDLDALTMMIDKEMIVLSKETMKRVNEFYRTPTETNRNSLLSIYNMLTDEVKKLHDVKIQKLLPSWGSY